MRTVPFKTILQSVARRAGIDPETGLDAVNSEELCDYINAAFKRGWEMEFWPEWTLTEERCVHHEGFVPLDEPGKTPIGTVRDVYLQDPQRVAGTAAFRKFTMSERGIELPKFMPGWREVSAYAEHDEPFIGREGILADCGLRSAECGLPEGERRPWPRRVWVTFRMRCPMFTTEEWISGQVYPAFSIVYRPGMYLPGNLPSRQIGGTTPAGLIRTGGDCFLALHRVSTDPLLDVENWGVCPFPEALRHYVVGQASAEALTARGNAAGASLQQNLGAGAIDQELTRTRLSQHQTRRYRVRIGCCR